MMPLSSSLLAKKNTRHLLKKRPPKRLNGVNNVNCKFQENHLSIQCMQIRVQSRFENCFLFKGRECVSTGAAGARTRRSLASPFAPADFEAFSTMCTH